MPPAPDRSERPDWPRFVLRRSDQVVVAAIVAVALSAMALCWLWRGGMHSGLVDVDRAQPIAVDFKIDVNRADWPELAVMPNVGEKLAKRIVADRAKRGAFQNLADLERVPGIGPKTVEGMKSYLLLPSPESAAVHNPSTPRPASIP